MADKNPTVYTTERGRICPKCGKPIAGCGCAKKQARPAGDGIVHVGRETKGHKGKTVTLVSGVVLPEEALRTLLTELKRQCGAGGSLQDGVIEIQGDHRTTILEELKKRGFTARKSGG
jgi:translation initiation factor 1